MSQEQHFRKIKSPKELGALIHYVRKNQHLTLETVFALTCLSMRFLSELERGKETAQLGKVLTVINQLEPVARIKQILYFHNIAIIIAHHLSSSFIKNQENKGE